MITPEKLKEIRQKALSAVADMEDGELKVKAFEIFLQHLLALETPSQVSEISVPIKSTSDKDKKESAKRPGSTKSRILLLKDEGFFAVPRSLAEIRQELQAHGWILPITTLSGPLQGLVQDRELRRIKQEKKWTYVNP